MYEQSALSLDNNIKSPGWLPEINYTTSTNWLTDPRENETIFCVNRDEVHANKNTPKIQRKCFVQRFQNVLHFALRF